MEASAANGKEVAASKNENNKPKANSVENAAQANSQNLIESTTIVTVSKKYTDNNKSKPLEENFNSYSRMCDPHTTDDSDALSESSSSKSKRSLLKHRYLRKHFNNSSVNNNSSSGRKPSQYNEHKDQSRKSASFYESKNNQYGIFHLKEKSKKRNNYSPSHTTVASTSSFSALVDLDTLNNVDINNNDCTNNFNANLLKFSNNSAVKPCLVFKNSLTSDEEISSNHSSLISSMRFNECKENLDLLLDTSLTNEAKQGILRQSSQKESDSEAPLEPSRQIELNTSNSSFKPVKKSQKSVKGLTNSLLNSSSINTSNSKIASNGNIANGSITLVVDDTRFIVDPEIFKPHSNTMLGRMFNSPLENKPNERGEYAVAYGISSHIFKAILEFYKHGIIRCPPSVSVQELKEACDYLLIPFDGNTVRCHDLRGFLNE